MKSICVYCGSANQASRKFFLAAQQMGETLAGLVSRSSTEAAGPA